MTADQFRKLALALPEATESAHMQHPDFRVKNKIFATLGYPDAGWGMVKLPPDEQEILVRSYPEAFVPAKGAWGASGSTTVRLAKAKVAVVRQALAIAWRAAAPVALRDKSTFKE
jgi:hypothetical protein